jgi:hypothetical protein
MGNRVLDLQYPIPYCMEGQRVFFPKWNIWTLKKTGHSIWVPWWLEISFSLKGYSKNPFVRNTAIWARVTESPGQ